VSQKCDCSAQRNLCCNLDRAQWAQLIAGEIPTVTMYESEQKLNEVENAARYAQQIQQQAQQQAQAYEQALQAANQWTYQAMPYRPAPHEMPFVQDPGQMAVPYLYNQAMPGSFGFFDNQQAPMAFDPAAYQAPFVAPFESGYGSGFEPALEPAFDPAFDPALEPAFLSALEPGFESGFEPAAYQDPFEPQYVPVSFPAQGFNLPGPAPRSQFPCQSCASTQCTCLHCPPVSQGADGAWSRACGRAGHTDNGAPLKQEFAFVEGFSQQPALEPSQPVGLSQCCETPYSVEGMPGYENYPQTQGL
jgi:hypothetical protein